MDLATLIQGRNLAALIEALASPGLPAAGATVEARVVGAQADGSILADLGGSRIALVLEGPEARRALPQPGATLQLRIEPGSSGGVLRASLLGVEAPATLPSAPHAAAPTDTTAPPSARPVAPAPAAPAALTQAEARLVAGPLLGGRLASQDGLGPLFASLRAVARSPLAAGLPSAVRGRIDAVLARALPVAGAGPDAEELRQAVSRSGLFLEARAAAASEGGPDLKGDLAALVRTIDRALAATARSLPATAERSLPAAVERNEPAVAGRGAPAPEAPPPRLAAPRRDALPLPQPIEPAAIGRSDAPIAALGVLKEQAEAALDRIGLSQYASLSSEPGRADQIQQQRWHTEVPLAFPVGIAMLPLRIEKEAARRDAPGGGGAIWRIRFALDVEPIGPLHGLVTLQGKQVGVSLWAEREATGELLRGSAADLEQALGLAAFESGGVEIRSGRPGVARPAPGQFLDRVS